MCTATNLTNLSSWQLPKPATNSATEYSSSNAPHNPKPKFSNYQMLIVNNLNKRDERNSSMNVHSKYFLSPIQTFQLTPEECNEILKKRATVVAQDSADTESLESLSIHKNDINTNLPQIKLRPYCCTECGKTFIQKHHLTTHTKVHSGIRPHACIHCGKAFTHKHCLNTHLLLHSSERPYQCNECKKSFTLKHHLISHAKVHSREKPFICTDCGSAFPLKRHLVTHTKFHAGERPFICEDCGESFAQKDHLVMHSRFHGFVNSFACQECNATFTRKFELVNHSRLHGHEPLRCPICSKEFMQKRTLVVHMRMHTGETPFNCTICGEGFYLRNDLTLHATTHNNAASNSEGKLLPCPQCGSCFNNSEALALHIKLHSGDPSLVNDLCTLTASLPGSNFPIHGNIKNLQSSPNENLDLSSVAIKIKSHICKFCSRAFSAKHGLQQHNRRHPEGTCTLKSHVCDTCSKAFYQKNHLLLHQRQHMEPSLRNHSYSKIEASLDSDNSEENKNFYRQGQSSNLHNSNNDNSLILANKSAYLSHEEDIVSLKFKNAGSLGRIYEGCNNVQSESFSEKEHFIKDELLQHSAQMHTGETPFNCTICGEGFYLRNDLTLHATTHNNAASNSEGKLLPCPQCGSCFNNSEALALHIKLHSGDPSLVNDLCTLTASLPGSNFPIHGNIKNLQSSPNENLDLSSVAIKIKSHICKFCSRAFSAKHGLQQHNRRHPEGTCTLKSHVCDTCSKAFYQKNHLLLHQRQHMEPSLRNHSYSKIEASLDSDNSEENKNFYRQGQSSNLHNSNNDNSLILANKSAYLSHEEDIVSLKFKNAGSLGRIYEGCNNVQSESFSEKEHFIKDELLQHSAQ